MKIQIKPHITEKSYSMASKDNATQKFTFKVNSGVRAESIKKAIEEQYKVNVEKINMINIPGKVRRFKGIIGQTKSYRKALVVLKKGQNISDFDIDVKENKEK